MAVIKKMNAKYDYKDDKTKMLKALRMSKAMKEKNKWTNESGSGFTVDDIVSIQSTMEGLLFVFTWGSQTIPIKDLNLSETEEAISWLEGKRSR